MASTCQVGLMALVLVLAKSYGEIQRDEMFHTPANLGEVISSRERNRFTQEEKDLILHINNAYRSIVQPSAKYMFELSWDNDLEDFAAEHAKKCIGSSSSRQMIKKVNGFEFKWKMMAEVRYFAFGSNFRIKQMMWYWWKSGKNYSIESDTCSHGQCNSYKTVVLANSYVMGCAFNYCEKISKSSYPTPATYAVCVYNGKFLSKAKPYRVGKTCSECTRAKHGYHGTKCRNNLCIGQHLVGKGFEDGDTSVLGLD